MKNISQLANRTTATLTLATVGLAIVYRFVPHDGFLIGAIACGTALYHTVSRGIIGPLVYRFREKLNPRGFWFRPHRFEAPLYRLLRVKTWKDKLPTYTPQAFSLKDADIDDIILNSCNAELVHEVCTVTGFLPMVMTPFVGAFWVFFGTSCATAIADSLFIIIQRYNRPRLIKLQEKAQRRL